MKIIIYWKWEKTEELYNKVALSIDELWLWEFIDLEVINDKKLKSKLNISKKPALIVEEENIDFIDVIFEWIIPDEEEIRSMIISVIWWKSETPLCATDHCWMVCIS
jgi:hypothetical protein